MKESGKMKNLKGMVFIIIGMEENMKEYGKKV